MTGGFEQLERQLTAAEQRLARDRVPPRGRPVSKLLPVLAVVITLSVIAVVIVAGVTSRGHPSGAGSPIPPGHPTQPTSPGGSSRTLPCDEAIGNQSPPQAMRVVLGVVALPASPGLRHALQTSRTGAPGSGSRLFAKWGLWVRSDTQFELIVPAALREQLSIGWGNAGEGHVGSIVTDPSCRAPGHRWINFAGGYWTTRPRCATVIVAAKHRRRHVRIGIGKACPGQLPPPQPTQR
jgi:hypothetical protein